MQVSCPHCQTSIEIIDDAVPDSLDCQGCGHQFERSIEATIIVDTGKAGGTVTFVTKHPGAAAATPSDSIGDYKIIEEIARGGMGVVYKARQLSLGRTVALKMILGGQFVGADQVQRFQTEARAAAKLDHAGIVPVYEVGQHDGQHFLSMAFVEGTSLVDRLAEGPLPPVEAARMMQTVAEAVQFAHDHGVVHRDLKPHNILLDGDNQPRITDFGLAKNVAEESGMTATGQIMGTPSYMSPEQAMGMVSKVGPLADVYSLGATLYHLLTGRPPFQAASSIETIRLVVDQEPAPPRTLNATIPRDLETICLKCLRKEPAKRYAAAGELADDLRRWLGGEPIKARPVGRLERTWLWCKRRPATATSIAVVLLLLAVGYVGYDRVQGLASVETLLAADTQSVLKAAERAARCRYWSDEQLREVLAGEAQGPDDERRQLHARLALVHYDESQVSPLLNALLAVAIDELAYLEVIRVALRPERNSVDQLCWSLFHDVSKPDSLRLRAGLVLADFAPTSERWAADDDRFMVEQLVTANAVYQPDLWRLLSEVENRLRPTLESVLLDKNREASQQIAAARLLTYIVPADAEQLARCLTQVTPAQYEILYAKYARVSDSASHFVLESIIAKTPSPEQEGTEQEGTERLALGRQRAASAITLLRQDRRGAILEALRYRDDPEALTQFVHGCRQRGVTPDQLIECFTEADRQRGPLDGQRRKVDDSVMFALLLALGEFEVEDLPSPREPLIERLAEIYAHDPDSGVHGAAGWLLRHWGFEDQAVRVDHTPKPYDPTGHREWYVMEIDVSAKPTDGQTHVEDNRYFTFIVLPPGQSTLGSPKNEADRRSDEPLRRVSFTRPIAVCDRPMTWHQWTPMEGTGRRDSYAKAFTKTIDPMDPVFGVSWFDAIGYCRWLTVQAGMSELDQCYPDFQAPGAGNSDEPWDEPLDPNRGGFRLLSEAEWERMCRAGSRTAFSFGSDRALMGRYAWFQKNAPEWLKPVAGLRPNPFGMFDVHGNVFEWCHDWYASDLTSGTDPFGPKTGSQRVCRGGSAGVVSWDCRSSYRLRNDPTRRLSNLSFRLALIPPGTAPMGAAKNGSPRGELIETTVSADEIRDRSGP